LFPASSTLPEQFHSFRREAGWGCMPILSFFVKRVLTISNAIPSSDFPTRQIKILSSIGKSDVRIFALFVQKPACFEGNFASFVKECCQKVQKTMFFVHRKIRRGRKKLFAVVGKRFFIKIYTEKNGKRRGVAENYSENRDVFEIFY
jgi:hypothetical protein